MSLDTLLTILQGVPITLFLTAASVLFAPSRGLRAAVLDGG